jgi:hypothetical protein
VQPLEKETIEATQTLHSDAYQYPNGNKKVLALTMTRLNGTKYFTSKKKKKNK